MGREASADDRGMEQDVSVVLRERYEALAHRDADARRYGDAAAVAVAPLERAAQQLFGDERPAVGELAHAFERLRGKRAIDARQSRAQKPVHIGVA